MILRKIMLYAINYFHLYFIVVFVMCGGREALYFTVYVDI